MKQITHDIKNTFDEAIAVLHATEPAQLDYTPPNGGWSVGQIAEHIMICSNGIPDARTKDANRPFDEKVSLFREFLSNDDQKFQADAFLSPRSYVHDVKEQIDGMRRIGEKLMHIAENRELGELCVDMELPQLGSLTRFEWLYFIICHTQRHTRQMLRTLEKPVL